MFNFDDKKILIISIILSLTLLIGGLHHMLSQWSYYEEGHGILTIVYAVACFAFFFAFRFVNIFQIIAAFVLLSLILFYADQKFEWQKNYIQSANKGDAFVLNPYIKEYPTLEERHFGWVWGVPSYIPFAEDCVIPKLKGLRTGKDCKSSASIQSAYNVDARALVNTHFSKMKRTAQRIEGGQMKSKRQYETCLRNKTCAIIPLLPANVDAEAIDRQSGEYLATRKMFWSLVNDKKISPEICEFMELCRALRDLGVMPIERPSKQ